MDSGPLPDSIINMFKHNFINGTIVITQNMVPS